MDWIGSYCGGQRRENRDPWSASPFSSDLWDPYNRGGASHDITSSLAHAHVDWRETDKAHIFRADLPGVRKEDLKVQVEKNKILQIYKCGERVKEKEDQNDKWHRVERQCGSFLRRFRLPEDANADQIGCTLENGVLTVTVPKVETKRERKNVRQIDVA